LGHKELVYQNSLEIEFKNEGLEYEREKTLPVVYRGKKVGTYQPDFVVDNKIIVELKALNFIGQTEKKQIWSYIKGSEYKLGIMINFGQSDITFERVIFDTARTSPRQSALSPRESANDKVPHLLSLTATPIPRTLQLAFYGELDISQIKTKPAGRKPITTRLVNQTNRQKAYAFIAEQVKTGRQAFVITPLIEESDKLGVKAAKTEVENLKKIFPDLNVGLMHGKLKGTEKENVMKDFLDNKIQILVSTSVVEVGVDIPNASIMMIEGAERFGLAQLHQFRGRVGRAEHQSYCLLFTENQNEETLNRLVEFTKIQDGFELAELDLKLRGFGELYGSVQSGINFKYFNPSYTSLIEPARQEALKLLKDDLNLGQCPLLQEKIRDKIVHFE
jgi:ATP-dependent DNA helicase RecG